MRTALPLSAPAPHAPPPAFDEVLRAVAEERPLEQTLDLIARCVSERAGFDFCGVLLADGDRQRIRLAGSHDFPLRYPERLNAIFDVPIADARFQSSPTRRALLEGRTVLLEDALGDPCYAAWRSLAVEYGFGAIVSVPLICEGRAVGVINGYSRVARRFTGTEVAMVETLAIQAALALRLTQLVGSQQDTITMLQDSNDQLEHHRAVLERAHQIHLRLTEAVISGADFAAVAQVLAGLIGRPIAVADAHGAIIGASDPPPDPALLAELQARFGDPRVTRSRRTRGGGGRGLIVSPIIVDGESVGCVVGEDVVSAWRDLDHRAIEHGATVLAVHVAKERVAQATEERLHSGFLHDLLDARSDDARLGERAAHHGLVLEAEHRVIVAAARTGGSSGPAAADGALGRDRVLRLVTETFCERLSGAFLSQLGDAVTVVVPATAPGCSVEALRAAIAEAERRVAGRAPEFVLCVGIGSAASGSVGIRASHDDARRCVDALQRMRPGGGTLASDELGVLDLFLAADRPERLVALGQQIFEPLLEYDERSAGALVQTLSAYLDTSCNLRACAEGLFVHQNTVKYRLQKIEQLCGLDLHLPEDLLRATIARLSLKLLGPPLSAAA